MPGRLRWRDAPPGDLGPGLLPQPPREPASNVSLTSPATWNVGMNRRPSMRNQPAEAPRKRPAQADSGQFSQ